MHDAEQRAYLRNLLLITHADARGEAQEHALLERVLEALGLSRALLREVDDALPPEARALDLLDLQPIARFSMRVRCLEDMIELALADGRMGQREKALLFDAAQQVGIAQAQVIALIGEAEQRLADLGGAAPSTAPRS